VHGRGAKLANEDEVRRPVRWLAVSKAWRLGQIQQHRNGSGAMVGLGLRRAWRGGEWEWSAGAGEVGFGWPGGSGHLYTLREDFEAFDLWELTVVMNRVKQVMLSHAHVLRATRASCHAAV
jgi:hypothetical protein